MERGTASLGKFSIRHEASWSTELGAVRRSGLELLLQIARESVSSKSGEVE